MIIIFILREAVKNVLADFFRKILLFGVKPQIFAFKLQFSVNRVYQPGLPPTAGHICFSTEMLINLI